MGNCNFKAEQEKDSVTCKLSNYFSNNPLRDIRPGINKVINVLAPQ